MSIDKNHELSNFVPDRLPEFVRIDHPVLVSFLGAYYEWLGIRRNEGKILSPLEMHDIPDIDTTLDQFVDSFKAEYLLNFPENLAIDPETKQSVDVRKLIINIKQFYLAKGTEKTYEFLFHILYNTSVEFYYPKKDILVLSGGKWTQNNYLRISTNLGEDIHRASGNIITQKNQNGEILASARVVEVTTFQIDNFGVAELLINGRNGTFQAGNLGIDFTEGGQELHETSVFSVVSSVKIVNGGSDYEIGDRVTFVPFPSQNNGLVDYGQQANGTVLEIDSLGGIRKIAINDFGINYKTPPKCVVESVKGTGFNSHVFVGSLCQSPGYYANFDGRLSTDKVMQDNHFYQNWSYVLKTEVMIDKFREIIRRLVHPVGIGMFGSVLIKRCASADLENASSLMSFHTPIIGHYTPYTFNTFDDLSLWFMEGLTGGALITCQLAGSTGCNDLHTVGYSPSHHDMYIQSAGQGLVVAGNPISNNIPFPQWAATGSSYLSLPNFPNADPFWIIYQHPNKMVAKGLHIAKIWNTQLNDFAGSLDVNGNLIGNWKEWSYIIENWRQQDQQAWFSELRSTLPDGGVAQGGPEIDCNCDCVSFEGNPCNCIDGIEGEDCGCGSGNICDTGREIMCCCVTVLCETCLGDAMDPCICAPCSENCGGTNNPCCGSSDPCCNPDSPCCHDPGTVIPDPCDCMGDVPCCGDNPDDCCNQSPIDPCCMHPDPCCGNPDPCCGIEPPCCIGDLDPCCGSTDPCCTNPDPCVCDPTSPCCTDPDGCVCAPNGPCCGDNPPACCDPRNPCCNSSDPCCDPDGPCCGSTDPCCDPESDCCIDPTSPACCQNCSPFCTSPTCVCDPCQAECGGGFCDPVCDTYDPCECDPGGVDCCAANPCNPLCPDSCECGSADPCVCLGPCNTACPLYDPCVCDPGGLTCCAAQPCNPCNADFDPCERTCPLFDPCATGCSGYGPCTPQCVSFDPCSTGCSGYGPCHPWCDTSFCATGCSGGGVCNPFCPLFDACNTGCASYDPSFCCNGCNCGGGGGIGRVIYRDPPIAGTRGVPPVYDPNENNPCFGVRGNCAFGTMNQEQYDFKYALLEYNENSEFRKITARAFFNMPQGQQFDCRQETISNVITPTFNILYPQSGNIASNPKIPVLTSVVDYNFFRNLIVNFTILNEENLQYYDAKKIIVYLDGIKRIESQMNTRKIVLSNMTNGRHTLKMEMHNSEDRLIAGTQSIVVFAYEFLPPLSTDSPPESI